MRPFVYLKVLAPGEDLPTPRIGTGEGFFPGMHPNVVNQLVLGLEGLHESITALPVTSVVRLLWPANVVNSEVRDDLVH